MECFFLFRKALSIQLVYVARHCLMYQIQAPLRTRLYGRESFMFRMPTSEKKVLLCVCGLNME